MTRWLETDTNANKDISAAVSIGVYTADADRLILCDVSIDQAAGSGDYVMYITRQIGGAGSAYIILPKTTMTAAAGEIAIGGQSGLICVRSGDVLTVYVDGLAGDTATPDTTVRWFELAALRPATADRTIAVDASGQVTSGTLATDAVAEITDGVWDETTASHTIAGSMGKALSDAGAAGDPWEASTRTLTQSAAAVVAAIEGSKLVITRGDTFSATLTGLAANTGYVSIDFTVKRWKSDADSDAIIRIRKNASGLTDGLRQLNGVDASARSANGSLTINSATSITITLAAIETDDLLPEGSLVYDIQYIFASTVQTATAGIAVIEADITRLVV